jgi:hypothetical protein
MKNTLVTRSALLSPAPPSLALLCLYLLCLILPSEVLAEPQAEAGSAGLAFLKVGIGARAVGMGEAFVATADDATALYWNPAGISHISGFQLGLMHAEWFQDIRLEYLGAVLGRQKDAFGLSFTFNTIAGIERRDGPTAQPLGTFDAHDLAWGFTYACHLSERWHLGGSLKALYEKIHLDDGWGWALDAGLLYDTPLSGLRVGGSLRHLGPNMTLHDESFKLPFVMTLGFGYRPDWLQFGGGGLLIAGDISKPVDNRMRVHLGGEWCLQDVVALRTGYGLGYDERSLSAGLGLRHGRWTIDYAWVPYSSDLGDTHRISLGIDL